MPEIILFGVLTVCPPALAIFLWIYFNKRKTDRKAHETEFRADLLHEIQSKKLSDFNFSEFIEATDTPEELARQVASEIFTQYCRQVCGAGGISAQDRGKLDALRQALQVEPKEALRIEEETKGEHYLAAAKTVLDKGTITPAEALALTDVRTKLGLSPERARELTGGIAEGSYLGLFQGKVRKGQITQTDLDELQWFRAAMAIPDPEAKEIVAGEADRRYRKLFQSIWRNRQVTPAHLEEMRRLRAALMISQAEAYQIIRTDLLALYRECVYDIAQDGEVKPEKEQRLDWIQRQFGLDPQDIQPYQLEIQEVRRLNGYRQGKLPSVQTSKLLEGGEICHWQGKCCYLWQTTTRSNEARGQLLVSSKRIYFNSAIKNISFTPSKIMDIAVYSDGLKIQTTGSQGTGEYLVTDPRELEAILLGLARQHKYLQSENFSSNRSRSIPDDVKRAVWARDGGCCVKCGATDYLEFDHIIPHSLGGANTVNNIQLLCRRCNLLKRNRI
jgi:hypothetical protein